MDEIILVGLNGAILAGIIFNSIRVGRLEGRLRNGDYLRCPFYRGNSGVNSGKRNKSDKETSSCR